MSMPEEEFNLCECSAHYQPGALHTPGCPADTGEPVSAPVQETTEEFLDVANQLTTVTVTFTLEADVHPAPGQSLEDAATEMSQEISRVLNSREYGFWDDVGLRPERILAAQESGEPLSCLSRPPLPAVIAVRAVRFSQD